MSQTQLSAPNARNTFLYFQGGFQCLALVLLTLLLAPSVGAQIQDPDTDFTGIHILFTTGDEMAKKGDIARARAKYAEAQSALISFKANNPKWNPNIIAYRLNYLTEKIAEMDKAATASGQETAAGPAKPMLTLLDAGTEPRVKLQLSPAVGDRQMVTLTMKMAMDLTMPGQPPVSMKNPVTQLKFQTEVKELKSNGDISFDVSVTDASVLEDESLSQEIISAMKAKLEQARGTSFTGKISKLGIPAEYKASSGSQATGSTHSQLVETLSESACPLPEEAVGPGAKWTYKARVKSQGMTMSQVTTYEVISIEGNKVKLGITMSMNASNQKIQTGNLPPGMKADLAKLIGSGNGTATIDMGCVLPAILSLEENTAATMSFNIGPKKQAMEMGIKSSITMDPGN